MASSFNLIVCPSCDQVFNLEQAWEDVAGRQFIELMTSLPSNIVRPFYSYLKLFKPEKQVLRWTKVLKLTQELAPMIKDCQVKRNGIVYVVPYLQWEQALTSLVQNKPPSLQLPLTKNAYLLTMLANQSEKVAAIKEAEVEKKKQNQVRKSKTQGLQSVAQVITKAKKKTKPAKPPEGWRPGSLPKSKN
ncbi:MAG: hypothetical protein GQ532_09950 [Methylomarinum sp.]|nr:hypothetical protein [Methylomarinum sp.]